jgi:tetratricopeptide (TPR) repeat protein
MRRSQSHSLPLVGFLFLCLSVVQESEAATKKPTPKKVVSSKSQQKPTSKALLKAKEKSVEGLFEKAIPDAPKPESAPKKEPTPSNPPENASKQPENSKNASGKAFLDKLNCEQLPQKTTKDLWNLAECYEKIGDYFRAVGSLREVSRRDPQDLESYFVSAWLLWREGRRQGGITESKKNSEALDELMKARLSNPTHWRVDAEIGDFFFLRLGNIPQSYAEYIKAREHYNGDYARSVPEASLGMKTSIENRIARATEILDRKGEAVEASCRALYFDPDDKDARKRIEKLAGSCTRKGVLDPQKKNQDSKKTGDSGEVPPL